MRLSVDSLILWAMRSTSQCFNHFHYLLFTRRILIGIWSAYWVASKNLMNFPNFPLTLTHKHLRIPSATMFILRKSSLYAKNMHKLSKIIYNTRHHQHIFSFENKNRLLWWQTCRFHITKSYLIHRLSQLECHLDWCHIVMLLPLM